MTIAAAIILIRPGVKIAQIVFYRIQKKVIFILLIFYQRRRMGMIALTYSHD